MLEKDKKSTKSVPLAAGGAKAIASLKKEQKVKDDDGNWISMDEMLKRSKEGGAGKGGRGGK